MYRSDGGAVVEGKEGFGKVFFFKITGKSPASTCVSPIELPVRHRQVIPVLYCTSTVLYCSRDTVDVKTTDDLFFPHPNGEIQVSSEQTKYKSGMCSAPLFCFHTISPHALPHTHAPHAHAHAEVKQQEK